ncbi:2-dehydropantoate 2-reductase N-terminal domain-containing protein [Mycobacterium sp. 236(2023)]|uniref:ketopantoate reductase family protein n=1 Tax=Mycobacterium sp. 236(2023) TaxID=3038163 RepID=UPI002415080F|nr:2-dehydropantoate 2-reductase N-terminal domain-containing protein [Mycobacterium sp. 236(2023)]MDG4667612.1 2-dehydropantoate 2-reductase N-terminal domain-containing protein [Mycobacterium sp. 236(2023)]
MSTPSRRPVVVYGAGAIGGVVAARLALAGQEVTAVARGEHLREIRSKGLRLVTETGTETVEVPAASRAAEVDWSARPAVVVAVKSHQTAAALDDLAAHAPLDTPVFVAQNGVANEAATLRRFANVYAVAVVVSAAHLEPGIVVQQSYPVAGILDLGRYPGGGDDVAEELAAGLRDAQFLSEVRTDIMAWKYRKLIANLGNGVTAAFQPGAAADQLVALARSEAEHVLTVAGIPFVSAEQDTERRSDFLRGRLRDDYFGSTWQSVTRGHTDVETDWFNGEIVLLARLHGLRAPANELIQHVTAEHARLGRQPRSLDAEQALERLAVATA